MPAPDDEAGEAGSFRLLRVFATTSLAWSLNLSPTPRTVILQNQIHSVGMTSHQSQLLWSCREVVFTAFLFWGK